MYFAAREYAKTGFRLKNNKLVFGWRAYIAYALGWTAYQIKKVQNES